MTVLGSVQGKVYGTGFSGAAVDNRAGALKDTPRQRKLPEGSWDYRRAVHRPFFA